MRFFALILFGLIAITFGDDYSYESDSYESDSYGISLEERILGGNAVSDFSKVSYQVGLMNVITVDSYKRPTSWEGCGGVLIHTEVVVTAAHCVQNSIYVAVFYATKLKPASPTSAGNIRVEPANVRAHKGFKNTGYQIINDIAVLILPYALKLGDTLSVIQLASSALTSCKGNTGEASGWGLIGNDVETNQLMSVSVTPMSFAKCKSYDPGMIEGQHLCISGNSLTGICSGDSGGPYVQFKDNGDRYLCGVSSYIHSEDCVNTAPKVFTSVAFYKDDLWICNNTDHRVGCDGVDNTPDPNLDLSSDDDYYSTDSYSTDSYSPDYYSTDYYSTDSYSTDYYSTDSYSTDYYSPYYYSTDYTNDNYDGGQYVYINGVLYYVLNGNYYYVSSRR